MKLLRYAWLLFLPLIIWNCGAPTPEYTKFSEYPVYARRDLGISYTPKRTIFKLWAPPASGVRLHLYNYDLTGEPEQVVDMTRAEHGVWTAELEGDMEGMYYTFQTQIRGNWQEEAADPYARAVGTNGIRAQVIDLAKTDPAGWANDQRPPLISPLDIVLYELHVRDASIYPESGIDYKGKFLGLTQTGTTGPRGVSTGLDHLKELGVTHVHLLPSFDFLSVDERYPDSAQYNWGYDPQNYNVPEGSYSTNPQDGAVRIREFKKLVQALHNAGIRVIMDVVYNHTGYSENAKFNRLVPGYYYRQRKDGSLSDASACGNEIASERPMVRKFIRESLEYWVKEYHIDGFRFDLMGIHDIQTMNEISTSLHAIDSTIFLYGEGWTAGDSPLPDSLRALKVNTGQLDRVAAFSDDLRDGLKGSVFEPEERGFVSGRPGLEESIKFGIVAAGPHDQVNYDSVNYSKAPWAPQPYQCINYVSCHDNHTLWDRLELSMPNDSERRRLLMHKLALTIVLTSQGVPFLHAGSEMARTKGGEENSYKSPDAVNQIDWSRKYRYNDLFEYVRDLIRIRKAHQAFRLPTNGLINQYLRFLETDGDNLIAYRLLGVPGDPWQDIVVVFNGQNSYRNVTIPDGTWTVVLDDRRVDESGLRTFRGSRVQLAPYSAVILVGEQPS
jgi:pullulanase